MTKSVRVFFYFTKLVLVTIFTALLVIVFCFQSDVLNLSSLDKKKLPSPTPVPARHINYFVEAEDPRLEASATERAQCISSGTCEFTHEGFSTFIGSHINYTSAGEVLAREYQDWGQVMAAWNNSASHSAILNREWCFYGAARSGDIFAMHFACE